MTINDKDRVNAFRRIIINSPTNESLFKLNDLPDNELLIILDSTILPNAISINNLKYTLLFTQLFSAGKVERNKVFDSVDKIKELFDLLTKSEKDLLKFGYFRGFDIFNWQRQMNKFISFSTNPEVGELKMKKTITSYTFQRIFPFIYTLISRGEKNEQFPRV